MNAEVQLGPNLHNFWKLVIGRKILLHHYKDFKGTQARIAHLLTCRKICESKGGGDDLQQKTEI